MVKKEEERISKTNNGLTSLLISIESLPFVGIFLKSRKEKGILEMTTAMTEHWKGMQKAGHWLLITIRFLTGFHVYYGCSNPCHAKILQTTVAR